MFINIRENKKGLNKMYILLQVNKQVKLANQFIFTIFSFFFFFAFSDESSISWPDSIFSHVD